MKNIGRRKSESSWHSVPLAMRKDITMKPDRNLTRDSHHRCERSQDPGDEERSMINELQQEKMYQILRHFPDLPFCVFKIVFLKAEWSIPSSSDYRHALERATRDGR